MTSISHEPSRFARGELRWGQFVVPEVWASLAIVVIWLSVLLATILGPDIVVNSVAGDHTTIPSAVALAPFAFFATWVVARYGFGRSRGSD